MAIWGSAADGGENVMRVLLVEDHARLALTVAMGLRRLGMAVDVAFDGDEALAKTSTTDYDVIVLDRDLPGIHGDEVCRRLVTQERDCRVLMLTAAGTVQDRVDGLRLGADDYLPKPFDAAELVARIEALARRGRPRTAPILAHDDLMLDSARRQVSRAGRTLALNPKEFAVLEQLLIARGAVVSAEELLERVWDENADPFTNAVKITISRLRAKLGDPPIIETVPKAGYRIGG
jgi:DNA-binding response OmpR family regulator